MAKVLTPLMSGKARGQIFGSLVFFPWKGINAVRSYVVPTNPRTLAQQAIRSLFAEAVDCFHETPFTAKDRAGWDLYATVLAKIMSGFNAFMRLYVTVRLKVPQWAKIFDVRWVDVPGAKVTVEAKTSVDGDMRICVGTTKTFFPIVRKENAVGGKVAFDLTGLLATGVVYFYWIEHLAAACAGSRTGLYSDKHL